MWSVISERSASHEDASGFLPTATGSFRTASTWPLQREHPASCILTTCRTAASSDPWCAACGRAAARRCRWCGVRQGLHPGPSPLPHFLHILVRAPGLFTYQPLLCHLTGAGTARWPSVVMQSTEVCCSRRFWRRHSECRSATSGFPIWDCRVCPDRPCGNPPRCWE